jgi:predicted small lipoprotein YifL
MRKTAAPGAFCMRRIIYVFAGVSVLFVLAACGGSGAMSVPSDAVAVVGDKAIPKSDWDSLMALTKRNYAATNHAYPKGGSTELAALRTRATQTLIAGSEYEQEAKSMGVKMPSDKDINDRISQFKQQFCASRPGQAPPSKQDIEKCWQRALKQQGYTNEDVRTGVELELIRERVQQKVTKDITVSDSDIKAYYDKHKSDPQFEIPAAQQSRDVRHILVKNKALAQRIYTQLKKNPSKFPALVKRYSQDPGSKATGGKYTDTKGTFDPTFEKVAFALAVNEISKPTHTRFGWHIIQALGPIKPPTPAHPAPLAQVKERIRQTLLSDKRTTALQDWQTKMQKHYCKTIAYQPGYSPAPGQDPCKHIGSTGSTATTAATTG